MLLSSFINDLVQQSASHGGGKIHILINNAGYTWDGVIHKMTDEQWSNILAVHNTAPFRLIRACAPYFRVRDGEPRSIINISSTSGLHGNAGQANYSLAKAGVTGLTKAVAKEWGPQFGVRANTMAFGHILTRLTAAKEEGAFVTTPEGTKVALGIPGKQIAERKGGDQQGQGAYRDIPLGRPGTATEAAGAVLAVASPYMSYGEYFSLSIFRRLRPSLCYDFAVNRLITNLVTNSQWTNDIGNWRKEHVILSKMDLYSTHQMFSWL